ncbi:SAM-dependent methyltransferase [Acetobacter indonesiensis]|uniref:class I SAM-dependent methyltransferase n=1 Tax=Acetobacter indonesiensis TaxID=104101 RepID=UPI000A38004A|nr:SAM-dependent methyltransferase [Acetobacter indonesiensis]OUI90974.1 SAM-dependent methyltransferase [Acetobacter indonesiensis]
MTPLVQSCPSATALHVARQRALHQIVDSEVFFADPLALAILGETAEHLEKAEAESAKTRLRYFLAARHRIAEDALANTLSSGMKQVVILGAGLDTLALRNPFPNHHLHFFEVDRPDVQQWKLAQCRQQGLTLPANLISVPVNFETDGLADRLDAHGFDRTQPAFFIWLGVVPYLSRAAIVQTLIFVGSIPKAHIVFDYNEPITNYAEPERESLRARERAVAALNEPYLSRFNPEDIDEILTHAGFSLVLDRDRYDLAAYFGKNVIRPAGRQGSAHIVQAWHET